MPARRLILRSFQSPGDIVMLTAAVRDLHRAHPGEFETDVRTTAPEIWQHNPHLTPLCEGDRGVESIDMHYPLIHESNQRPYHFIHGYPQYLEQQLGIRIPVTAFHGDIHLSEEERETVPATILPPFARGGQGGSRHPSIDDQHAHDSRLFPEHFWIIVAGGKYDFTAKWWNPASFQAVVDHFRGQITFVQCGEAGHWHPPLEGVINLVGKTNTREFIRLVYHAEGVLCPVTFAMHLAAAVPKRPERPRQRACVVVAGGREPAHWEMYPQHQFLSTAGALACCAEGGCWKSRCQPVGDGDPKDRHDLCLDPVLVRADLRLPRCMELITPRHVIDRIELYYRGGALAFHAPRSQASRSQAPLGNALSEAPLRPTSTAETNAPIPAFDSTKQSFDTLRSQAELGNEDPEDRTSPARQDHANMNIARPGQRDRNFRFWTSDLENDASAPTRTKFRAAFYHGLGDCVYFAHLIPLYVKRGYDIEVECTPDKRILFEAAGATTVSGGSAPVHSWSYPAESTHAGQGRFWQGNKMAHNISEPPLPDIGEKSALWDEYCRTSIDIRHFLPAGAVSTAERWLAALPHPVVLLHTKANTAQHRKSLPDPIAFEFYKSLLDRFDGTIILLDWDNRVPRLLSCRVRHLDDLGACPTETLMALLTQADLMVGVDSGPLHAARFTHIPTVGLWMPGHYPATYTLPRREQLNVVLADHTREWNRFKRIPWNIVEHPGATFDPDRLADLCVQMLSPPRYLHNNSSRHTPCAVVTAAPPVERHAPSTCRFDVAADVQLQQFVREWCRGKTGVGLSAYPDRHRSFDLLLREMSRRFERPIVIETGTIRGEEDWAGAGFFTYLVAAYLFHHGGKLHTVDLSPIHSEFARTWTAVFGETVAVYCQDSLAFLKNFREPIDVLYLDSLDTYEPGHAEHAERELEAARPNLHEQSLIVVDDNPWRSGVWEGKGTRVVPRLVNEGWKILYGGYQVLLAREVP